MQTKSLCGGDEVRVNKIKVSVLMAKQELNQTSLANKAHMSRNNLSIIMNGKSCRIETALKIAEALGVDVTDIIEQ